VTTQVLNNGLLHWCKQQSYWTQTRVQLAIGAGTANDPRGLYGRSRYLAHLFRNALNLPKNPARSQLSRIGTGLNVKLGKEWITVTTIVPNGRLKDTLKHLGEVLKTPPRAASVQALRDRLIRSSRGYPPPSTKELLELFLFPNQPRSVYLRGKTKTFQSIKPLALQTAYEKLFRGERMRLMVLGGQSCTQVGTWVKEHLGVVRGKLSKKVVKPAPPARFALQRRGRYLVRQKVVRIYSLPTLRSRDVPLFQATKAIALQELQHQLKAAYQRSVKTSTVESLSNKGSYFVVAAPLERLLKKRVEKLLKASLGSLLLRPWKPRLKGRFPLHQQVVLQRWREQQTSATGTAALLWPQLLLAGPKDKAVDTIQVLKAMKGSELRTQARRFLRSPVGMKRQFNVSSFQRIAFFFGSLFLLWFLLDFVFRRARQGSGDE
jgi:hypothetical protein